MHVRSNGISHGYSCVRRTCIGSKAESNNAKRNLNSVHVLHLLDTQTLCDGEVLHVPRARCIYWRYYWQWTGAWLRYDVMLEMEFQLTYIDCIRPLFQPDSANPIAISLLPQLEHKPMRISIFGYSQWRWSSRISSIKQNFELVVVFHVFSDIIGLFSKSLEDNVYLDLICCCEYISVLFALQYD